MMWELMRLAAIARHRIVWRMCGSQPGHWLWHQAMIDSVYGQRER